MRKPLRLSLLILALFSGWLSTSANAQRRDPFPRPPVDSPKLSRLLAKWRLAVAEHDPGERDKAVETIAEYPLSHVIAVVNRVKELAALLVGSRERARLLGVQSELGLTDEEMRHGNANRILKRGALLHTDIALLAPEAVPHGESSQWLVKDGRLVGQDAGPHWDFARLLLDSVKPHPSDDETVHQWYLATSAIMQDRREWGLAIDHLSRARSIFPSDARILLYSGTLREFFAGSLAQNSLAVAPQGVRFDFGSRGAELKQAAGFFHKAVEADPAFAEALLRLGRVAGLLGDHSRSVVDLQKAAAAPRLLYYAMLFLGYEHEPVSKQQTTHSAAPVFKTSRKADSTLTATARCGSFRWKLEGSWPNIR